MSSLRCECGASIDDIADHSTHKGRLLSDIEYCDVEYNLAEVASNWLTKNAKKLLKDGEERETALRNLADLLSLKFKHHFREVFICTRCGRLYIQQQCRNAFVQFIPNESPLTARTLEVLSSVRGRLVRGWWDSKKFEGTLYWEKFPWDENAKEIPSFWEYKDFSLLEQRYYKLLEQLKEAGVQIRDAGLVNGNKVVHRFSADFPESNVSAE